MFDTIVQYIIRPRRAKYSVAQLGPTWFKLNQKFYIREDFIVKYTPKNRTSRQSTKNIRQTEQEQLNIVASIFMEGRYKKKLQDYPCVVYLHGNIGSRMSTLSELEVCLKLGYNLVCFDFIGAGLSDGEYITLGYEEKYQINAVINSIKQKYKIKDIILYGRSMGAASALFYYQYYKPTNLIGMILDSPYCDVNQLLSDISQKNIKWLPNFIKSWIFEKFDEEIKQKIGYSMLDLKISQKLSSKLPIFIFYAENDEIITKQQISIIIKQIDGNIKLKILPNQKHNGTRQEGERVKAYQWIMNNRNPKK